MGWPKIIEIGGVKVPVESWAELREAIQELGQGVVLADAPTGRRDEPTSKGASLLNHGDRTLLIQFIEAGDRGLLTHQIGQALGKQGKGVRPALERWAQKIGLVTEENATAFESLKRFDGRGFKMLQHYRMTAAAILGRPMP
jgi:hypothetical protein